MYYINLILVAAIIVILWPKKKNVGAGLRACPDDEHGLYAGCESVGADPRVRPDWDKKKMKNWQEREDGKDLKRNYKGRKRNGK